MENLSLGQKRVLVNFCSDIARGALLSGLGFSFVLQGSAIFKITFSISSFIFSILALYSAIAIAKETE